MSEYVLEMNDMEKQFPGVKALDHAQLRVRHGSVHALMGENGAGKSTLMKCLFGVYVEDGGEIFMDGESVRFHNPKQAMEHGVSMVHQELNQVMQRTVMENIWLGRYPIRYGLVDEKKMYADTKKIFQELDMDIDPKANMKSLSVSARQMVEIAKASSYEAKILVLDEPTSSLTEEEVQHLFAIIETLKKRNCAIIYISHKMEEILAICDEVTILRDGQWVDTQKAKDLTTDWIIKKMVGRDLTHRFPPKTNNMQDVILQVKDLCAQYQPSLQQASFELHAGEILGIAGLVGSRRTELLETIFGIAQKESGEILLHGKPVNNRNAHIAIRNGFALLTEERRFNGIFAGLDVEFNAIIASLKEHSSHGFLRRKECVQDSTWVVNSMHVKTPSLTTKVNSLSGGNQQKVIIGRWLLTNPEVLLLDEPTRGIDVGAKYEIYQLIIDLANKGKGVIMVSSEMSELLGICDRILVMSNGRVAGIEEASALTQERIMTLAAKYV